MKEIYDEVTEDSIIRRESHHVENPVFTKFAETRKNYLNVQIKNYFSNGRNTWNFSNSRNINFVRTCPIFWMVESQSCLAERWNLEICQMVEFYQIVLMVETDIIFQLTLFNIFFKWSKLNQDLLNGWKQICRLVKTHLTCRMIESHQIFQMISTNL